MAQAHFLVELPWITGLPEDLSVNTFTFVNDAEDGDFEDGDLDPIIDELIAFYNDVPADTLIGGVNYSPVSAPAEYLSPVISRVTDQCVISAYDLTTAMLDGVVDMGAPQLVRTWTLDSTTGAGLPPQLELALTLEAEGRAEAAVETGSTRPKQRRTGFVKFGPLTTSTLETAGTPDVGRVGANPARDLIAAVHQLHDRVFLATGGTRLGIWSRVDEIVRPFLVCSTDDVFDDLESRRHSPSVRFKTTV